jgi:GT2 family glycosyltransferase
MSKPTLDIVVVDYDAGALLRDCLSSLVVSPPVTALLDRVVVVDNASNNPSRHQIQGLDLQVELLRNEENIGFAAACNQGARRSKADFLLFLNPDARLGKNSLDIPARFLSAAENRDVGIVGIQLMDDRGRISTTCRSFPRPSHYWNQALGLGRISRSRFPTGGMEDWDHGDSRQVDQVMGAFFFVRREVFDQLGGFDERYFVYFEEVDFSLRALQSGWRSIYLSEAKAFHAGCGTTDKVKSRRLFYSLRSRILYAYKHFGWFPATSVLVLTVLVEPISRVVWALSRGAWSEAGESVKASGMLWLSLAETFRTAIRRGNRVFVS